MALHDAEYGGKSQAPAGEFRREERIEDLLQGFGRHADSVVLDFEERVGPGRHDGVEMGAES